MGDQDPEGLTYQRPPPGEGGAGPAADGGDGTGIADDDLVCTCIGLSKADVAKAIIRTPFVASPSPKRRRKGGGTDARPAPQQQQQVPPPISPLSPFTPLTLNSLLYDSNDQHVTNQALPRASELQVGMWVAHFILPYDCIPWSSTIP